MDEIVTHVKSAPKGSGSGLLERVTDDVLVGLDLAILFWPVYQMLIIHCKPQYVLNCISY